MDKEITRCDDGNGCCISTFIDGETWTFGSGKLYFNGTFEFPCEQCARHHLSINPNDTVLPNPNDKPTNPSVTKIKYQIIHPVVGLGEYPVKEYLESLEEAIEARNVLVASRLYQLNELEIHEVTTITRKLDV